MLRKRRRKSRRAKRGKFLSAKMNVEMTYRSSWELAYFRYLDNCDNVKAFWSESLKIEYVTNIKTKKTRNYIPDLLIEYNDGTKQLVEIKPKSKLRQRINLKKFKAAERWSEEKGLKFILITEVDLKELGLL